jgi:succinate dehydrogenase / fumarate reductase cytochrome b subunit
MLGRNKHQKPMTARIERPLSPHIQVYRWTLTMALSIVHRATGIALYAGTLLLVWWLVAAASGPAAYANVQAFTGSIIGRLIVFGYTWALMHHMLSGVRHFFWDLGYGFKANEREALTWGAAIGGIVLTVLIWIVAYAIGGGR